MFDDEKHPESPPPYSSSTSVHEGDSLNDTSHGVTLTVTSPPSSFIPGSNLQAELNIPNDVLSSIQGDIECRLEGKSSVEVMGKQRYQKAQMLNASMGGNAMPISGREEHLFALTTHTIPTPSGSGGRIPLSIQIPGRKTCSCPPDPLSFEGTEETGIMPSLGWKGSLGERNRVTWKLKVGLARKGLLKRDIKLSIEIPISLPLAPPCKSPLTATLSKPLSNGENLEATMTILPSPSQSETQHIPFQLTLRALSMDISEQDLKVSVGLCKHIWTKGIDTSLGSPKGHDFPGIMVGSLSLFPSSTSGSRPPQPGYIQRGQGEKGEMVVEGEYEVGEDMKTARGCGLRLSWSLQAQIRWKELGAPMVVSQVVHLPHYTAT